MILGLGLGGSQNLGGAAAASNFATANFSGDGVLTDFVIVADEVKIASVFVNGVRMKEGVHYTKNNATKTVTFVNPVPDQAEIEVDYFTDLSVGAESGQGEFLGGWDANNGMPADGDGSGSGGALVPGDWWYIDNDGGGELDANDGEGPLQRNKYNIMIYLEGGVFKFNG